MLADIVFTNEDKGNKGLRKDLNYLTKLFGKNLPEWLVYNVLRIRRNERSLQLLNNNSVF